MIQLGIIAAYLALLVALGAFANRLSRGTSRDYLLASHSIGPFLLLMSLFGTTMTSFALVGSTGQAYLAGAGVYGLLASASGIVHSLCFFLIGVPLWSLGRKYGYTTQIQFFHDRLDTDVLGLLLFPILVFLVISYLMLGVLGGGEVVQVVTAGAFQSRGWFAASGYGVPSWLASAVICAVVLAYVFFGGMRGTAWANAFQTTVFMTLGVVTFVVITQALGGTESLWENARLASAETPAAKLMRQGSIPQATYFSFLLIPLSVGMFPHVFQHWLTARNANAFKLPIIMHPIFIMIVWLPCVLLGVWANTAAARIPEGAGENQILGLLVQLHAGPVLGGLLTAGILAAIMSSLDSQFLCVGTMFTHDVLRRGDRPLNDHQTTRAARLFIVAVVVATYVLSLVLPRGIFNLGIWSFTGFTGLFPLVFAALYWRRLSAAGAVAGVVTAIVSWGWLFWRSGLGSNPFYGFPEAPVVVGGVTWIPKLHPVVSVFVIATVTTVVVSLCTKPPKPETLKKFFP